MSTFERNRERNKSKDNKGKQHRKRLLSPIGYRHVFSGIDGNIINMVTRTTSIIRPVVKEMITSTRRLPIVTGGFERVRELSSSLTFPLKINKRHGDANRTNDQEETEDDERSDNAATDRSFHFW
jgi:hypothetical protein